MDREKQLLNIIKQAQEELSVLKNAKRIESIQHYIGKYYKLRDSYGRGRTWSIYYQITHIANESLYGWSFEKNPEGAIKIELNTYFMNEPLGEEITSTTFWNAWYKLLNQLNTVVKDKKIYNSEGDNKHA